MAATFIPLYYCGDNLTVALNTPYQNLPNIIETIYFNVSDLGADQPIYGHTERLPSQFSPGTRLMQGTFAVPLGLLPDWVMNYPNQGNGTITVQPENTDLPLLIIKAVNIQGIHQSLSPDGEVSLQTVSFIGIHDPNRVQTINQQLLPKDIVYRRIYMWEIWAESRTWTQFVLENFPLAQPAMAASAIDLWTDQGSKKKLKVQTDVLKGDVVEWPAYEMERRVSHRWVDKQDHTEDSLVLYQHVFPNADIELYGDSSEGTSEWYLILKTSLSLGAAVTYIPRAIKLDSALGAKLTAGVTD
jgi:hypothetical protein